VTDSRVDEAERPLPLLPPPEGRPAVERSVEDGRVVERSINFGARYPPLADLPIVMGVIESTDPVTVRLRDDSVEPVSWATADLRAGATVVCLRAHGELVAVGVG